MTGPTTPRSLTDPTWLAERLEAERVELAWADLWTEAAS